MQTTIIIAAIAAAVAALISWALTHFIAKSGFSRELALKEAALTTAEALRKEQEENAEQRRQEQEEYAEKRLGEMRDSYERSMKDLRENHEKTVSEMREAQKSTLEAAKKELALENEKALKTREEELHKRNLEEMKHITTPLNSQIEAMTKALNEQKEKHTQEITAMVTKFEETARNMKEQTDALGGKADNLADALKGGNKMQGCWGERQIKNIFDQEGLIEGRDYDKEEYLYGDTGEAARNADSGKKMRPDYILHFPNDTDILVDAKTNITAYVDWFNSDTEDKKDDARRRNLAAIKNQIRSLSDKSYQKYVGKGRKTINYVIMYVSNYGALQLAKQDEPNIVNEAFKQNVLVTTEETFMPFLRIIHTAWVNVDQIRNQELIVKQASLMCERVADFCSEFDSIGKSLKDAMGVHERAGKKLQENGASIVHAAREVVRLGVPISQKKSLPEVLDM